MVRNALLSSSLQGFYGIIEEEVDQDGINLGLGMLAHNLPPDQLYTPDAATCNTPFQSAVSPTHCLFMNSPLNCISQFSPGAKFRFSLTAMSNGGLYDRQPRLLSICGTR